MAERWVNAKFSFTVPLDGVSVEDSAGAKLEAATILAEQLFADLGGDDAVGVIGFEDVEDGEPIGKTGDEA